MKRTVGTLLALLLFAGCGRSAPEGEASSEATTPSSSTSSTVATPTSPATAAPTTQPTYVIQSGDSLSIIAERFGVTTAALAEFNAIEDVNAIKVGQEIRIPPAEFTTTPTTGALAETTTSSDG